MMKLSQKPLTTSLGERAETFLPITTYVLQLLKCFGFDISNAIKNKMSEEILGVLVAKSWKIYIGADILFVIIKDMSI